MGNMQLNGLADTGTHVRLRIDAQNRLWRMTIGNASNVLTVNFLGRNAPAKSLTHASSTS